MKRIRNEDGYALMMVLMLIVLFTVLGMGLMATNMNSAKQFSMKENQVQARHQAEMGVLHYGVILEDKITSLSSAPINCTDIDALLGPTRQIAEGDYAIEPADSSGSSCKEVENSKLLEITIRSIGFQDGGTEKEVEATFYAENQGEAATVQPPGGLISPPAIPNTSDTIVTSVLAMKKDNETFLGSLIIKDRLDIGGGNSDNLKVLKDLYIAGNISIQNHAYICAGGDFTAAKAFNWGSSKTALMVRKDAYLPSAIGSWSKNQVNVYIFGNLYLPQTYNYSVKKEEDRNLFIGGTVYQLNTQNKYVEIANPFKALKGSHVSAANNLPCSVPAAKEETPGLPKWVLQDDKIINYQ